MEIPNQVRNYKKCLVLFCDNYKAQQRVAGKPAILKTVTRLEAIFLVQVYKTDFHYKNVFNCFTIDDYDF